MAAAFEMLFGGLFLVAAGSLRQEWRVLGVTARTFTAWAYLVLFGGIAGFSAYVYALTHLPLSTVWLYVYVNPIIAVALGTFVLGEPFSPRIAIAAAVVMAGTWIVRRSGPRRRSIRAAATRTRTSSCRRRRPDR